MVRRKEVFAWAMYDFANSAFHTLIVTFIFSAYFTQVVVSDPDRGAILWSRAINISAFLTAVATPFLGAMADLSGRKKAFLAAMTLQSVIFTAALFTATPGTAVRTLIFFVIADFAAEAATVFYNAFLPEIATKQTIGRISGIGWGVGYAGGLLSLLVALAMIRGLIPNENGLAVRSTNILAAVWFLIFSIPLFLWVKESKPKSSQPWTTMTRAGFARVADTVRHLRSYREAAKLVVARMIYNDGLVTVFSFASIFAAAVFGMNTEQLIVLGLALNVVAGISAVAFGYLNDKIGGKKTIAITIIGLTIATLWGAYARSIASFWAAAMLLAAMMGPNQAASRSLMSVFVPESKHAEFFGFFAFSGKLASVLGPLTYGTVLSLTGSQRTAMASMIIFFVGGLVLLLLIREREGIEMAERMSQPEV